MNVNGCYLPTQMTNILYHFSRISIINRIAKKRGTLTIGEKLRKHSTTTIASLSHIPPSPKPIVNVLHIYWKHYIIIIHLAFE